MLQNQLVATKLKSGATPRGNLPRRSSSRACARTPKSGNPSKTISVGAAWLVSTLNENELKRITTSLSASTPKASQNAEVGITRFESVPVVHVDIGLAADTVRVSTNLRGQANGPTLTGRKWQILQEIFNHGPSSAARIAESLGLSEQAVSKHLSELFERRLIEVDASHGLRRPRVWVLSIRGKNLVWAAGSEP